MRARHYDFDNAKLQLFYSGHPVWQQQRPGIARTGMGALRKIGTWLMYGFIAWAAIYFLAHGLIRVVR